jgi:hypothetical protein
MKVFRWAEAAIRAGDFAGLVPASRGAHCRPLHPRLARLSQEGIRRQLCAVGAVFVS